MLLSLSILCFINPASPFLECDGIAKAGLWITFRPAIGGAQIHINESGDDGMGTLGFTAIDEYGTTSYVTAAHVAKSTQYQIWQPCDYQDDYYKLGKVTKLSNLTYSDSALVPCDSTFNVSPEVYNPNDLYFNFEVESYADAVEGHYVFFSGKESGLQGGTIIDDDKFMWNEEIGPLYHQCMIDGSADNGDSGSPVFKITGYNSIEIVGLLHADNGNPIYSHVSYVMDDLDVVPYTTWHTDWTPWNDPDSEDGTLTTTSELQEAIKCWLYDEPTPKTSEMVPTPRLQQTIGDWLVSKSPGGGREVVANRTISSYNVTPNSTFTIMVNITPDQYTKGIALDEDYPDGWNIISVDDNNGTFKNSTVEWIWTSAMSGGETCTVTYNATVPGNITGGIYNMTGFTSACDVNSTEIGGDYEVYVMDDWNPWNDYDSEDGRYISRVEMQSTLIMWQTQIPVPRTGELITRQQMQYLLLCWKKQIPCY